MSNFQGLCKGMYVYLTGGLNWQLKIVWWLECTQMKYFIFP